MLIQRVPLRFFQDVLRASKICSQSSDSWSTTSLSFASWFKSILRQVQQRRSFSTARRIKTDFDQKCCKHVSTISPFLNTRKDRFDKHFLGCVPFGKSKSGFLIWWILFEKRFIGFEIRRIQIQINGLVIYAVPFTVDPKLVRWSSGISSWSIPIEAVEFPRCCHLPQNIWKH